MKSRIKSFNCIIMVLILLTNMFGSCFPVFAGSATLVSKDSGITKKISASGSYKNWDGVTNVAQFEGADGNMYIAVDDTSTVTIYKTSASLQVTGSVVLTKQHPTFGTALCDKNGNFYLVTGEANSGSDTNVETIFISKYSSSGAHIATTGDNGSSSMASYYDNTFYTQYPFEAGCCDAAISGKVLAVNYARKMYSGHQSNSVFAVNIDTMDKVAPGDFYESHSFAQRTVAVDNGFVFMSEGDCYSRGFDTYILNLSGNKYSSSKESKIFDFWIEQGAFDKYDMNLVNNNFAHMGGMAALSNGNIAFASSSVKSLDSDAANEKEDIFIQIFIPSKDLSKAEGYVTSGVRSGIAGKNGDENVTDYGVKWLTSLGSNEKIENVQIAATADDKIIILYEYTVGSTYKGVYYMILDASGNVVQDSAQLSDKARLNPCEMPVYANGKVCWAGNKYGDSSNTVYLYAYDPDGSSDAVDISGCTIEDVEDQYYIGEEIEPAVTVKDGNTVLEAGTDYSVSYQDNINAGLAMINVSGKGNYCGMISATFNILPKDITELAFYLESEQEYTGNPITPDVIVKDGNKTLKYGTDYTIEYIDNLEPGTATVKITGKGNYTGVKSLTFTIKKTGEDPVSGNKLIIDKESATLEVGETLQLNVTIESDEILAVVPEWTSSKSSVAKVSEEGLVTALSEGNTVITATFEDLTAECKITVIEGTVVVEPDHIVVTPPAKTEYEQGEELKLDGGKVTVYYTDESTETVSLTKDMISGYNKDKTGIQTIKVSYLGMTDTFTVTVKEKQPVPVSGIVLDQTSLDLKVGNNKRLTATVEPDDAVYTEITWTSSAPEVAKVSDDGMVTALSEGNAVVTVTVDGIKAECKVTVSGEELPQSGLNPTVVIDDATEEIYLVKGQKFTLNESGWSSSNKKYLTVSRKNQVTAKKETNAPVQLIKGRRRIDVYISKPTMGKSSVALESGAVREADIDYDAENLPVVWSSSNPDVAIVSEEGNVTAVAKGSATITAYINGKAYNCKVRVKESTAAKERTLHMTVDTTKTISIKGVKDVEWVSDNEGVVSVSGKKITAVAPGDATISTEYEGQTYYIDVYVENPAIVSSVIVSSGKNKYNVKLSQGEAANIEFEDMERDVIFKSSKADIAFADENMVIWGARPGKAKLTAKINGKTITINVTVE